MAPRAWYMDDKDGDQRLPHMAEGADSQVSGDMLIDLGVLYWKLDADKFENDPDLEKIRSDRGYDYQDIVTVSPDKLPNYETKLKNFYEEHIHTSEEIRYVLEGSGYFDVRDREDRWIRIEVHKGDMIVLPEGIYHRFTLDTDNYIKAMRLFRGSPIWEQLVRPQDENASRIKYVNATPEELQMTPPPLCA